MKNSLRYSGLVIAGALTGLIIAEVFLRVFNIPTFYQAHTSPAQFSFIVAKDSTLIYTNVPSQKIEFRYDGNPRGYFDKNNSVVHTTNSSGFRGGEFKPEKDTSVFRIAFLGDSFTFGEGVKDEDVFSEKIVKNLSEKYSKLKFEAYNFGVGGYNTSQSLFLLKNLVLQTKPDIVVLGYNINDAEPELFYIDYNENAVSRRPRETKVHEGLADKNPPKTFSTKFNLGKLIWKFMNQKKQNDKTIRYYQNLYKETNSDWLATKQSLAEFQQVCSQNNIHCCIALLPLLYQLDGAYPFQNIHEQVKAELLKSNIENTLVIDLLPAFSGKKDVDLWVHPTDQHPNEIAHSIIADELSRLLSEKNSIH